MNYNESMIRGKKMKTNNTMNIHPSIEIPQPRFQISW